MNTPQTTKKKADPLRRSANPCARRETEGSGQHAWELEKSLAALRLKALAALGFGHAGFDAAPDAELIRRAQRLEVIGICAAAIAVTFNASQQAGSSAGNGDEQGAEGEGHGLGGLAIGLGEVVVKRLHRADSGVGNLAGIDLFNGAMRNAGQIAQPLKLDRPHLGKIRLDVGKQVSVHGLL